VLGRRLQQQAQHGRRQARVLQRGLRPQRPPQPESMAATRITHKPEQRGGTPCRSTTPCWWDDAVAGCPAAPSVHTLGQRPGPGSRCGSRGEITLRDATDQEMFRQVGCAGALVITKDRDFIRLLDEQGPPPQVIGLPVGNGSNAALQPVWSAPFSRGWAGLSAAFRQRHWRRTPSPKAAEFSQRLRSLSLPMGFC